MEHVRPAETSVKSIYIRTSTLLMTAGNITTTLRVLTILPASLSSLSLFLENVYWYTPIRFNRPKRYESIKYIKQIARKGTLYFFLETKFPRFAIVQSFDRRSAFRKRKKKVLAKVLATKAIKFSKKIFIIRSRRGKRGARGGKGDRRRLQKLLLMDISGSIPR